MGALPHVLNLCPGWPQRVHFCCRGAGATADATGTGTGAGVGATGARGTGRATSVVNGASIRADGAGGAGGAGGCTGRGAFCRWAAGWVPGCCVDLFFAAAVLCWRAAFCFTTFAAAILSFVLALATSLAARASAYAAAAFFADQRPAAS